MNIGEHTFVLPYYGLAIASIGLVASLIFWVPVAIAVCLASVILWGTLSFLAYRYLKKEKDKPSP
jgi:membrane protein implicated in regulation of membrane protease activity